MEETKEHLLNYASFRMDNPFVVHDENYEAERFDRKPRAKPSNTQ